MSKDNITVLAIDPSINNCGWSVLKHNFKTGQTTVITHDVLQSNDVAKKTNRGDFKTYGNVYSLFIAEEEFKKLMEAYQPDYVACESCFFNPRMPGAFASLKLFINALQRVLYKYFQMTLYEVAPKEAKQCVSTGVANKVAVQEGIQQLEDLTIRSSKQKPADKMVEHEADSIAIGYTFIKTILPNLLLQES